MYQNSLAIALLLMIVHRIHAWTPSIFAPSIRSPVVVMGVQAPLYRRRRLPAGVDVVLSTPSLCTRTLLLSSSRCSRRYCPPLYVGGEYEATDWEEQEQEEEEPIEMGEWDERVARLNSVHLTGRIGNKPEPRYFDDGKVVVNTSLATKRKYHSLERKLLGIQSGEEETDWYGLEIWGATAEFVANYVDKGARVGVIGQLQIDTWIDRETGQERSRPKIIVRDFDVLESKAEAELRRNNSNRYSQDDGGGSSSMGGFFG